MRLSLHQLQWAGISCILPARQRLEGGWWGSLGLLLWVLLLAGILQTLYSIGTGGGGAPYLHMTSLVPGILVFY